MIALHSLWNLWSEFFFHQERVLGLALFRIGFGLSLLLYAVLIAGEFDLLYGRAGLLPETLFKHFTKPGKFFESLNLRWIACSQIPASLMVLIGWQSQVACGYLFLTFIILRRRNPYVTAGPELFMQIFAFLMMFAPADASLSMRYWLANGDWGADATVPAWSIQLIRLQVCIIVLHTVLWKMTGPAWRSGVAVWRTLQDFNFRTSVPFPLRQKKIYMTLNYSVLAIQIIAPFSLWVNETRIPTLIALAGLHFGLWLFFQVGLYQPLMLSAFMVFLV